MLRIILTFGLAAGLLVATPLLALPHEGAGATHSALFGYLIMILALSLIFVGVKRFRDRVLGGVIRFGPALVVGLGISGVASVIYVIGWEITLSATHYAFADTYSAAMIEAARAKGASAAEIDRLTRQMAAFRTQYANPIYRLPMTFAEIFPVGLAISILSAALLRNPRVLPAPPPRG